MKAEIRDRLLRSRHPPATTVLRRLGQTAAAALRTGRLARTAGAGGDFDAEALARLVESIGQLKGIAMKAGQLLSYVDIALPEEIRAALSVLQTHAPPMSLEQVRAVLQEDLGGRSGDLLHHMSPVPLAAASIGQVHRARLPSGTEVAVKVQYPEVERAIEADFGPASAVSPLIRLIYPGARVDACIGEARARFLEECDYLREARLQARFGELFADHSVLSVPAVHHEYCSRRVLTSTFVEGMDLDAFLETQPEQALRDRIGAALFEFYVGTLFRHRLYNCDPHPGNYLFAPGGRVAMLDYGCSREFEPALVQSLAALTRAVHRDEHEELHGVFVALGMVQAGRRYDFDTARGLVRSFYGPMLEDRVQAVRLEEAMSFRRLVAGKRELMRLRLPGEFLFLFRIRFGLMSVLSRLGARANWYRLERKMVGEGG